MAKRFVFILFVLAFVSIPIAARAQYYQDNRRIMQLLPERDGVAFLRYSYNHRAEFHNAPGEKVEYHVFDLWGSYPIPLSEDAYLAVGILYDLHHFRLINVTNYFNKSSINGHIIGIPLNGLFVLGEDWFLDVNFTPTIASDLESLSSGHDFQFNGYVSVGWAFSDIASIFFGVMVSKDFWTYLPYPLLGFVVRPEDSFFNMEIMLPYYARFNFDVASYLTLFAQGEFKGYVWDVTGDGTVPNHFMKMYDSHAGGGAQFHVMEGIDVEVWGGANPYRKYSYRDRTGQTFTTRQDLGYFVEAKIVLTPDMFINEE